MNNSKWVIILLLKAIQKLLTSNSLSEWVSNKNSQWLVGNNKSTTELGIEFSLKTAVAQSRNRSLFILVSSIRTPILIQGRLERMGNNLMYFKWEVAWMYGDQLIAFLMEQRVNSHVVLLLVGFTCFGHFRICTFWRLHFPPPEFFPALTFHRTRKKKKTAKITLGVKIHSYNY